MNSSNRMTYIPQEGCDLWARDCFKILPFAVIMMQRVAVVCQRHLRNLLPARSYARAVYAVAMCLSVRPSVTSRHCTKTAKRRMTQTTPTIVQGGTRFLTPKISARFRRDFRPISRYVSETVQDTDYGHSYMER